MNENGIFGLNIFPLETRHGCDEAKFPLATNNKWWKEKINVIDFWKQLILFIDFCFLPAF